MRVIAALSVCIAAAACGSDRVSSSLEGPPARSISFTPASVTLDAVGATQRVHAIVRDATNNVIENAPVEWSTTSSSITLALPTTLTAAAGVATPTGPDIIVVAVARGPATVKATSGAASAFISVTVTQVPAQIVIVSGNEQTGTVGSPLAAPLVVKVLDRLGNPIGGQSVSFSARNGSVAQATTTTAEDGTASTTWTLGNTTGAQEVLVSLGGSGLTATFTATANSAAAAKIVVESGNNQTAPVNTTVAIPPSVRVTDAFDNPIAGAAVTFAVASGGGSVTNASATTNTNGIATVGSWRLGPVTGANTLTASLTANPAISTTFTATATGAAGFTVTVRFLSSMSASQQEAFTTAAAKWSAIITGDLPDVPVSVAAATCGANSPALNETVDDVLIFATISAIDGVGKVLGSAGPCFVRSGTNGLTVIGEMQFDEADVASLETNNAFSAVVLHEMGHVLGIGTFWPQFGLQNQSPVGGPAKDTFFPGANAIAGFNAIGGTTYTQGQKVPVENTGEAGTINAHWRESVLKNELMTGYLNPAGTNPLSLVTVRSLQDIGYTVNPDAADPFFLSLSIVQGSGPTIPMIGDVRTGPVFTIDASGFIRRR